MANNNGTEEAGAFLIGLFVIIGVIAFFLVQWLFIILVVIISAIVVGTINSSKKKNLDKEFKRMYESAFGNSTIKPTANVNRKELKEKLGIFDIDIYDDLFEPQIRSRGCSYFSNNKLEKINGSSKWTCVAKGTKDYNVMIAFDDDKITYTSCTCPYYQEDKKNCKHIYALLLEAKSKSNIPILEEAIFSYWDNLTKLYKEEIKYINDNQKKLNIIDKHKAEMLNSIINRFVDNNTKSIDSIKEKRYDEKDMFNSLVRLIQDGYQINENIKTFVYESNKVNNPASASEVVDYMADSNRVKLGDVLGGMLIADEIDKSFNKNKKSKRDEALEKEMDVYNLEDWQKDLVRKGEYDSWNFDEEDLEEGDYHYEDDN